MTAGGRRAPLFKVHAHPIRVLVDYGYMPVKHRLTPQELAELKAWLEAKPSTESGDVACVSGKNRDGWRGPGFTL
jgi:hypothetical protein